MAKYFNKPAPYYFKPMPIDDGIIKPLLNAFENLDRIEINRLWSNGYNINLTDNNGRNGLHIVLNIDDNKISESVKVPFIKELINMGIDINKEDNNHKTPLHVAVYKQYENITKILLDNGAYVDYKDINGMTPLHLALIKLVKSCPEEKKISELIKEPEYKETVNSQIVKLILKNFFKKITDGNKPGDINESIKKMFDFITENISMFDRIDNKENIQNKINEKKNEMLKKFGKEKDIKQYSLDINRMIENLIESIKNHITKNVFKKLYDDSLLFGITKYDINKNSELPPNINITNSTIDTIFNNKIGKDLLSRDIAKIDNEIRETLDMINTISSGRNVIKKRNEIGLLDICSDIKSNGAILDFAVDSQKLYNILNISLEWLNVLQNTNNHPKWKSYNNTLKCVFRDDADNLMMEDEYNLNKLPKNFMIKGKLDYSETNIKGDDNFDNTSLINDMKNIIQNNLIEHFNIFTNNNNRNVYDILNNNTNQYNSIDYDSLRNEIPNNYTFNKNTLDNVIDKYFESFVNNESQKNHIFYSDNEKNKTDNINTFKKLIKDTILKSNKPIENGKKHLTLKVIANFKLARITPNNKGMIGERNYVFVPNGFINIDSRKKVEFDLIDFKIEDDNIQQKAPGDVNVKFDIDNLLGSHVYIVLLDIVNNHNDIFNKLTNTNIENILDIYNGIIDKFTNQYYYIGRLINMINKKKREYENSIVRILEFFKGLVNDKKWIPYYDEIMITLNDLLRHLDGFVTIKNDLQKALNNQRNNIIKMITLLNKKNAQKFLLHNIDNIKNNKLEYINRETITNMFPILEGNENDVNNTLDNINISINKGNDTTSAMRLNADFFKYIFPNFKEEIYLYDTTAVPKGPLIKYKYISNKNSIFDELNNITPNLIGQIESYNNQLIYDKNCNLKILNPIINEYLNYIKHELILEIYKILDPNTNEKEIFELVNNNLPPNLKDNLYPSALYLKIIESTLKEIFENFAHNTAIKFVNDNIQTTNLKNVITFPQLKSIGLSKVIENIDNYEIDISKKTHYMYKNLLVSSDIVNKNFFNIKEKILRTYELEKLNESNKLCIYNNNNIVKLLFEKIRGKYDLADNDGNTPIYYAINGLLIHIIPNIIDRFEILNIKNKNDKRPIELAIKNINSYYKIFYNDKYSDIMNNITNKYNSKFVKELTSIPEFGNNILKNTSNSMKKFVILLSYYLNQYISTSELKESSNLDFITSMIDSDIIGTKETQYLIDSKEELEKRKEIIMKKLKQINKYFEEVNIEYPIIDFSGIKLPLDIQQKYDRYLKLKIRYDKELGEINNTIKELDKNIKNPKIIKNIEIEKLKLFNIDIEKPFCERVITMIDKDYITYSNLFGKYIDNIDDQNHEGLLLLYMLKNDYENIVNNIINEFNNAKSTKFLPKDKFQNILNEINIKLPNYQKIEKFMNGYEKNISLSKSRNLEENNKLRDIILLYQSVLLSDITCQLKDSILSTLSQYQEQLMTGEQQTIKSMYGIDFNKIDEQLTRKLIKNKFSSSTSLDDLANKPEETFTGLILLNKFNLRHEKTDKGNLVYKEIGDLLSDVATVLNTEIMSPYRNLNVRYSDILEKNVFAFFKKNYSLMIECLQLLFNDIMAFYINCGRHLTLLKILLEKLLS
jgi:hypothetical protein